jgi:hypothetical protein
MTEMDVASPFLTTREAAAYTRSSAKTLRRAELAGELTVFKPGKTNLYLVTDLDLWVASKAIQITPCAKLVHPKLSDLLAVAP